MKKLRIIIPCVIFVIIIIMIFILNKFIIIPLNKYDSGEVVTTIESPRGDCYAELSYVKKEGAPLLDDKTEILSEYSMLKIVQEKKLDNNDDVDYETKSKIIYYNNKLVSQDDIKWINNDVIQIGDKNLNYKKSVYDYRIHFFK